MSAVMKLREFTSYAASPAVDAPPSSRQSQMDASIARLRESAKTFAKLSLDQRIVLVNAMQRGFLTVAKRMVQAGCKAKGITLGKPEEAEEWATGPWGVVTPQGTLFKEHLELTASLWARAATGRNEVLS